MIYHLSKRRLFKYQEEIEGFVVPNRYRLRQGGFEGRSLQSPSSTITNTTAVEGGTGDGDGDGEKDGIVVVDWYGPDDPENPQNWYVKTSSKEPKERKDARLLDHNMIVNPDLSRSKDSRSKEEN